MSVTPPSEHSITRYRKLEEQSEVPSDFFENVDFSVYFKTFKTLKDNISLQLFHGNDPVGHYTSRNLLRVNSSGNKCYSENGDGVK